MDIYRSLSLTKRTSDGPVRQAFSARGGDGPKGRGDRHEICGRSADGGGCMAWGVGKRGGGGAWWSNECTEYNSRHPTNTHIHRYTHTPAHAHHHLNRWLQSYYIESESDETAHPALPRCRAYFLMSSSAGTRAPRGPRASIRMAVCWPTPWQGREDVARF